MSLKEEERSTLVNLYLSKCDETLNDARLTRDQGRWNASANRLYYALFHAITALFVSDGIPVHSHNGMKIKFGKEYVLTGLATDEEGKLLSKMETMRERADYDATFTATEALINERFDQVEKMILHIKVLIDRNK
jgi:uncharacterized protein (UPF0332 family)